MEGTKKGYSVTVLVWVFSLEQGDKNVHWMIPTKNVKGMRLMAMIVESLSIMSFTTVVGYMIYENKPCSYPAAYSSLRKMEGIVCSPAPFLPRRADSSFTMSGESSFSSFSSVVMG